MNGESVHMGDLLSAYADGELDGGRAGRRSTPTSAPARPAGRSWRPPAGRRPGSPTSPRSDRRSASSSACCSIPAAPAGVVTAGSIRAGAVSLAATASIWLAVVGLTGLTGNRPGGLPALNSLVSLHEESTPAEDAAADQADQQQIEQDAAALGLPPSMGAYHLQSLIDAGQPQQATYTSDRPDPVGLRASRATTSSSAGSPPAPRDGCSTAAGRGSCPLSRPPSSWPRSAPTSWCWSVPIRPPRWPTTSSPAAPTRPSWTGSRGPARASSRPSAWAERSLRPQAERGRVATLGGGVMLVWTPVGVSGPAPDGGASGSGGAPARSSLPRPRARCGARARTRGSSR